MLRMVTAFLFCMASMAPLAHAETFKCSTPDGKSTFQDRPCALKAETQSVLKGRAGAPASADDLDPVLAAVKVGSTAYLIERMAQWCAAKAASSVPAIHQAKSSWHSRH